MTNTEIAVRLRAYAADLARSHRNLHRVRAVRQAAFAVLGLEKPVNELGVEGLKRVPGIGPKLAKRVCEIAAVAPPPALR